MYEDEDDDERMDAAERLARLDPRAGAEAFRAIAGDDGVDDELRIDAAEQLTRLEPGAAAKRSGPSPATRALMTACGWKRPSGYPHSTGRLLPMRSA
jgi:hypothetical protein